MSWDRLSSLTDKFLRLVTWTTYGVRRLRDSNQDVFYMLTKLRTNVIDDELFMLIESFVCPT